MIRHTSRYQLLFLVIIPVTVAARPDISINNIYYTVSGETAWDIWTDIMKQSPVRQNGKTHVAYTKWHVDWKFWWFDKGETCEINKVSTSLDITYTLPRLEQSATIPDSLLNRWQSYYSALLRHEQGHKNLGIKAAEEIEREIAAMGARPDCEQLERDANDTGNRIIKKYSKIEKQYDQSTNHGLNTGAVFP